MFRRERNAAVPAVTLLTSIALIAFALAPVASAGRVCEDSWGDRCERPPPPDAEAEPPEDRCPEDDYWCYCTSTSSSPSCGDNPTWCSGSYSHSGCGFGFALPTGPASAVVDAGNDAVDSAWTTTVGLVRAVDAATESLE
jgi:hypothetical protein